MNILIATLFVFFACWLIFLLFAKSRTAGLVSDYTAYIHWLSTSMENMFFPISEKNCSRFVLILTFLFAAAGFFVFGKLSDTEIKLALNRAVEFNKKGEYQLAIDALRRIRSQKIALIYNELGVANLGLNNDDMAEIFLKKAIDLVPYYYSAHINLAELYSRKGRTEEAQFEYLRGEQSIELASKGAELKNFSTNSFRSYLYRIALGLILGFIAFRLPRWAVRFMQRRRINKFESQFASALQIVASSLRAGLNLVQSIEQVSLEAPAPVSQEFELVLREYRLGSSIEEALTHLEGRMKTTDTEMFVSAIKILRKTGGNLVEVFENIVQTINDRTRVRNKIKTLTAEGKAQAIILALIPPALGYATYKLNYESFRLIYTTLPGVIFLILMISCEVVGIYWMLKIIDVKV